MEHGPPKPQPYVLASISSLAPALLNSSIRKGDRVGRQVVDNMAWIRVLDEARTGEEGLGAAPGWVPAARRGVGPCPSPLTRFPPTPRISPQTRCAPESAATSA
jgi:hypothetical protein